MATQAIARQTIAQQKGGLLSRLAATVRSGRERFAAFVEHIRWGIAMFSLDDDWYGGPGK